MSTGPGHVTTGCAAIVICARDPREGPGRIAGLVGFGVGSRTLEQI